MEPTILHVEDEPALAEFVQAAFERFGFRGEMLWVSRVAEALALIRERKRKNQPLDLILVDMRLPDGTGLDLVREVKANSAWSTIPVLVLSSEADPKTVTEAYALGANCFVSKSPQGKSIMKSIRALYECWLEDALLPEIAPVDRLRDDLGRAVGIKARTSDVYARLAHGLSGDPELSAFWLERALNEGNLANLLAFFQNQLSEKDVAPEVIDRISGMQIKMESNLRTVEGRLEATPGPSSEHAYRWALELVASLDEEVFAEALGTFFPIEPVATKALRERLSAHLDELATRISAKAGDPEIRRQAELLRDRVQRLRVLTAAEA